MSGRHKSGASSSRRRKTGEALAITLGRLAVDAPQVMASRMGMFALAGAAPSARDRAEFSRMLWEKQAAALESWVAFWQDAALGYQRFWFDAAFGRLGALVSVPAMQRSLEAVIAPYQTRASANARRLRTRR